MVDQSELERLYKKLSKMSNAELITQSEKDTLAKTVQGFKSGEIIDFSCKVGSTVWIVSTGQLRIYKAKITEIKLKPNKTYVFMASHSIRDYGFVDLLYLSELNVTWFLDENAAIAKLEEIDEGRQG